MKRGKIKQHMESRPDLFGFLEGQYDEYIDSMAKLSYNIKEKMEEARIETHKPNDTPRITYTINTATIYPTEPVQRIAIDTKLDWSILENEAKRNFKIPIGEQKWDLEEYKKGLKEDEKFMGCNKTFMPTKAPLRSVMSDIVPVQPMSTPSSLTFYLDYVYKKTSRNPFVLLKQIRNEAIDFKKKMKQKEREGMKFPWVFWINIRKWHSPYGGFRATRGNSHCIIQIKNVMVQFGTPWKKSAKLNVSKEYIDRINNDNLNRKGSILIG